MTSRSQRLPRSAWVPILKRTVRRFKRDNLTDLAAGLTYYGLLALFPGMLVLVSILGFLGASASRRLLSNVGQIAPGGVHSFLQGVMQQVQGQAGAASVAAVVGVLLALWSASGYVAAFMRTANTIFRVGEGRPIWATARVRVLTTVALVIMLVMSAAIVVLSGPIATHVGHGLGIGHAALLAWEIAKWPVLVVLVSVMVTVLYKATPNVRQPDFRWISAGGVLAVLVWIIASVAFAVYVSFSGSYNKTYGAFATAIIFLVWLWISNIAILFGAEFNAEIHRERAIRAGLPEQVEPFAEIRDLRKLDDADKEHVERVKREHAAAFHRINP